MPALADLGGDDQIVGAAPPGQPSADDRLRFAAFTAVGPLRVGVGGIDEVPARADKSVEDREGCFLVGGPAKHVAAQAERKHLQVCVTDPLHRRASCGPGVSWPPRYASPSTVMLRREGAKPPVTSVCSFRLPWIACQGFSPVPGCHM